MGRNEAGGSGRRESERETESERVAGTKKTHTQKREREREGGEGKRETETKRQRQRDRARERKGDRGRHREREREKERKRKREKERKRDRVSDTLHSHKLMFVSVCTHTDQTVLTASQSTAFCCMSRLTARSSSRCLSTVSFSLVSTRISCSSFSVYTDIGYIHIRYI